MCLLNVFTYTTQYKRNIILNIYIYIYIPVDGWQIAIILNILLLDINFDKFTNGLHFLISSILAKFP